MTQSSFFPPEEVPPNSWPATRAAAEARLKNFLPKAGQAYAQKRNFDWGPNLHHDVSALSPWLRHRSLLETDVLSAALRLHGARAAEKFIQEVFWRGYFKGWLEHRPIVWQRYKQNLLHLVESLERDAALARRYESAVSGGTGIACFDAWARELKATGYLHNHARMWFASIWIFTLDLPWELGADFFYRHLLDGDPASNTCSWRWICGLHTKGKTYLARASNIEKFTGSRFNPEGQLALSAEPLTETELPALVAPNFQRVRFDDKKFGLLMTEEDMSIDRLDLPESPIAILALSSPTKRSVLPTSKIVQAFAVDLTADAAKHAEDKYQMRCPVSTTDNWAEALGDWASEQGLDSIVTPRLPIGPVRKRLKQASAQIEVPIIEITRPYDEIIWPYTKRGFFALKKKMPRILEQLGLEDGTIS